jgi:hypothetical protein
LKKLKNWVARSFLANLGIFFVFPLKVVAASNMGMSVKEETAPYNQMLQKMETKAENTQLKKAQAAALGASSKDTSVVIVDPVTRAADFKEAYTFLTQYKAGAPIYFELQNGEKLYNVIEISVMKGGSLMIFKTNSTQGQKFKVVKTEDIVSLGSDA